MNLIKEIIMQPRQFSLIKIFLLITLVLLIGCDKKDAPESADDQKKSAEESIKYSVGGKSTDSISGRKIVVPTDHKTLQKYLPKNIPGFSRLDETGATSRFGASIFATAEVIFTKNDGTTISVQILDYAGIDELYAPYDSYIRSNVSVEDDEGYTHTLKIKNFPAIESYQKNLKTAQLSVIINNRLIVDLNGTEVDNFDDIRTILNKIDLNKLAELIK